MVEENPQDAAESESKFARGRRWVSRRNVMYLALGLVAAALLVVVVVFFLYRTGQVDRIIANQIVRTLASYGIRAEIGSFRTRISPREVELRDINLYDAKTGAVLGRAGRVLVRVRIEDLYALNLRRNVNLEELTVENLEAYVAFDEQGLSNFRNITLPPPDPNSRILFSYSTAKINLVNGTIHYDNAEHKLSGEARNVRLSIEPDDLNAPEESRMNRVALALSDSTFVYDGQQVNNIGIDARGRVNQTRAEIQELVLRSPITETRAVGVMDDWRALRYRLDITSQIDLTQLSDVLAGETTLRGAGRLVGTITGEGSSYQILDSRVESDGLAIDNIRLKGLNVTARGGGDGANYEAQARAVAELLTVGDFQINAVQLAGNVRGTGTDFRWLGELRAAAARQGTTSVAGLFLSEAAAEVSDGGDTIRASANRVSAANVRAGDARVNNLSASGVRVDSAGGRTNVTASGARAASVAASGARVENVTAGGVEATSIGDNTSVVINRVNVGGLAAAGASTGSINIAGVRLAINGNRVEGRANDFAVGTVTLSEPEGRLENVQVAKPVFTVEPAGRYRVTADLSLGGGVLGQMNLGRARAALTATNNLVQLNNLDAELLNGRASGDAALNTGGGTSRVAVNFTNLDLGGLLTLATNRKNVTVAGQTTGAVELTFPGTDFAAASGTLRANFNAETGDDARGRTPLNGQLALRADRGLFQLETANLRTGATELNASGQFSLTRDSDLQINLASSNAAELRRLLGGSGLAPDIEEQLNSFGVELGGKLAFNGRVTGPLDEPLINGRASVDSFILQGRDLGSLSAALETTPTEIRVRDGRLAERDGGGIQFALTAPILGEDNIAIDATLERANGGNLVAALPGLSPGLRATLGDIGADLNGRVNLTGFPGAMQGAADLRLGPGRLGGQQFQEVVARANFAGSTITLETLDARFDAGRLSASGTVETTTQAFNLKAAGTDLQLSIIEALAGGAGALPSLSGAVNLTASAEGRLTDPSSYQINFDAEGREVAINGRPAGVLTLTGRTENQRLNVTFTSGLLGRPQSIVAQIDFSNPALSTTIETSLENADLTPLFAAVLPDAGVRITGRATGTLRAAGNLFSENDEGEQVFSPAAGLRGVANFTELVIQVADTQLAAVSPLQVQFTPDEVVFERTQFTGPGTDVRIGGTAALSSAGKQNLTLNGRLNLRVLNGLSPDVFVSGATDVAIRVSGTYEAPLLSGTASVAGGSFSTLVSTERIAVNNINGRVKFTQNAAQIESLSGTLGGGRVEVVSGGARLEGLRPVQYRAVLRGRDVTVPLPQNITATADANLEIRGTEDGRLLDGLITLRRAEYTEDIDLADLINRRREASLQQGGGGGGTMGATTQLNLQVQGNDALAVRNNLADVVGSVNLRVRGNLDEPIISGRVSATRGTIVFRNDRYELTRAFVDLPAQADADPILNVQAETDISGYRVIVSLSGELSRLQAVVRSEPALPQADVVALITTGSLSSGDSSLAQAGVDTATGLVADTIVNAPVRRATDRLFGLNVFEIDPLLTGRGGGGGPTARLTVGRQINRNLSLTYSTDFSAKQNQVVALEYRLSDRLSFIAQYAQGSSENLRSRNNDFSFEIRFRKRF